MMRFRNPIRSRRGVSAAFRSGRIRAGEFSRRIRRGWALRRGARHRLACARAAGDIHPAEGSGAAVAPPAAVSPLTSLATLLTSHLLRDGEAVILILRPSVWFIFFNSVLASATAILLCAALARLDARTPDHVYVESALFIIAGWVMWVTLQWMGRLYVLTDQRVLKLNGIFNIEIFDCPLRAVIRTRMVSPAWEKCVSVGSIEIIPKDETMPSAIWQTVAKPNEVHEQLMAAIRRAKQSGMGE